jgi:hypothetical protein
MMMMIHDLISCLIHSLGDVTHDQRLLLELDSTEETTHLQHVDLKFVVLRMYSTGIHVVEMEVCHPTVCRDSINHESRGEQAWIPVKV